MQIGVHLKTTRPGSCLKLPGTKGTAGGQPPIQTEPAQIKAAPEKAWGPIDSLKVAGNTILNGMFPGPIIGSNLLPLSRPEGKSVLARSMSDAKNVLKLAGQFAISAVCMSAPLVAAFGIYATAVSPGDTLSAMGLGVALTGLCTLGGGALGARETRERLRSQIQKDNEQEVERVARTNELLKAQHQDAMELLKPNGVYRGLEQTPENLTMYLSDGGVVQLAGDKAVVNGEALSGVAKVTNQGVEFHGQGISQKLLADGSWKIHVQRQDTQVEVATQGPGSLEVGQARLPGFEQPVAVNVHTDQQAITILSNRFALPVPLDLGR